MSDHEELIAKANQRIPNLPRESLSNQEKLILDMRNALEAVTVPTENEHANGLPSREELAVAILMVTQEGVSPEYAWSVQYAEVQDELLAQADAVLELLPSGLPVPVEPEWEYRRFLPSDSRLQSYQEYSSMPPLAEGWVVERRTVGEWQQVAPDEVTEGGTQ